MGSFSKALAQDIAIDETNFPDEGFRKYVQWIFNATTITKEKAQKVTTIFDSYNFSQYVNNYQKKNGTSPTIESVVGIKNFPNITSLYLPHVGLKSAEELKALTKLTNLNLSGNELTNLDVSECSELSTIDVSYNKLTDLDISSNVYLTSIEVSFNQLTSLDVSKNDGLGNLKANHNQLTQLDVSKLTNLRYLEVSYNQLTNIDMSKNTHLINFYAEHNNLTSLDLSNCVENFQKLKVGNNQLTKLYLPPYSDDMDEIYCDSNKLEELDISIYPDLEELDCRSNRLKIIDIASCPEIYQLNVEDNQLTWIALSSLESFERSRNYIPCVTPQQGDYPIYLSGSKAYLAVPKGFDTDSVSNLKLTLGDNIASTSLTLGETTDDGMVQLLLPDDFVTNTRQSLFKYSDGSVSPMTITYDYATGLQGEPLEKYNDMIDWWGDEVEIADLKKMSVTINATCYMLPVSGETDAEEHYGSVCLPYDFTLPEGAAAYSVTAVGTDAVTLTTVAEAGGVVPANTPVVLKTDNSLSLLALNKADAEGTTVTGNLLQGTTDEAITATDKIYVLGRNSETGKMGFWHPADGKVGSWRVYLDASKFASASAKGFSLSFDGATGISQLPSEAAAAADSSWYTLSGTRLQTAPTEKGIYIHEGKKVVIK